MATKLQRQRKWIAFNPDKRWLRLLTDKQLQDIIDRALDGEISNWAEQLVLIPDRRKGRPDVCGVYKIGSIKKSDCLTLKQLVRQIRKTERVTDKPKNTNLTPNKISTLVVEMNPDLSTPYQAYRNDTCVDRRALRRP